MNEKVPTLHKSRYLQNAPTEFSVKLQAVKVILLLLLFFSISTQVLGSGTEIGVR